MDARDFEIQVTWPAPPHDVSVRILHVPTGKTWEGRGLSEYRIREELFRRAAEELEQSGQ